MKKPTDVTFYWENEQIRHEYINMQEDLSVIKSSFRILFDSAEYDGNEYIFPNSSAAALQESDLLNLSAKQLRIAKMRFTRGMGGCLRMRSCKAILMAAAGTGGGLSLTNLRKGC